MLLISRPVKAETVYNICYARFLISLVLAWSNHIRNRVFTGTTEHRDGSSNDQSDLAYYLNYFIKFDKPLVVISKG